MLQKMKYRVVWGAEIINIAEKIEAIKEHFFFISSN